MRRIGLASIKVLHTLVFFGMSAGVFYLLFSALTGRITRWTWIVCAAVVGEGGVLLLFGGSCPLRLLAEELGEERGSVTDIFLPKWLADRIFVIFTPLAIFGMAVLALRSLLARRGRRNL
jgi:hypothetical protein